jgi:hypothetical protein
MRKKEEAKAEQKRGEVLENNEKIRNFSECKWKHKIY